MDVESIFMIDSLLSDSRRIIVDAINSERDPGLARVSHGLYEFVSEGVARESYTVR